MFGVVMPHTGRLILVVLSCLLFPIVGFSLICGCPCRFSLIVLFRLFQGRYHAVAFITLRVSDFPAFRALGTDARITFNVTVANNADRILLRWA